jgi:hypothetical protein
MRRVILAVQTENRLKSLMSTAKAASGRIKDKPEEILEVPKIVGRELSATA